MIIKKLNLLNFRNHQNFQTDFAKTNIILGPNATGKSNLLEALYLLATTRSFKTTFNQNLISFGKPFAKIEGEVEREGLKSTLELILIYDEETKRVKKQARVNKKQISLISLFGLFLAVLFTPETLDVVLGSPSLRRRSLDFILSSVSKKYTQELIEFLKILKQRNKLLLKIKEGRANVSLLDIWDQGFLKKSYFLRKQRKDLLENINNFLPNNLKLVYVPSPLENLEAALKQTRQKEVEYGFTLIGPQKDDFTFLWKNNPLALFGSRGEIREGAVLFKLAEWEFIRQKTSFSPVLLLDDIFSELDKKKRESLESLFGKSQIILTTTSLSFLGPAIIRQSKVIELE